MLEYYKGKIVFIVLWIAHDLYNQYIFLKRLLRHRNCESAKQNVNTAQNRVY